MSDFKNLTPENINMFAINHYDNPSCVDEQEFLDDRKKTIKCKKNRAIIFDGSILHHSTTPTDVNYGCSINIDYLL